MAEAQPATNQTPSQTQNAPSAGEEGESGISGGEKKEGCCLWWIIGAIIIGNLVGIIIVMSLVGFFKGSGFGLAWIRGTGGSNTSLAYPAGSGPGAAQCLDDYIKKAVPSSPMIGQGATFVSAGQQYNVSPALMVAIARQESAFGTAGIVRSHPYNYFGMTDGSGGWRNFTSWSDAINFHAKYLREQYLDKGLTSIAQIGAKYAPEGAGNDPNGLNSNWVRGVTRYYNDISSECFQLEPTGPVIAGKCYAGYNGPKASCGWMHLPNESYYTKYGSDDRKWGTPTLVNLIMGISKTWVDAGNQKLFIGDMSTQCNNPPITGHVSHRKGIDVDIDIPGGMLDNGSTPDPNYNRALPMELAKKLIECGATDIGYQDPQVIKSVNQWAAENNYSGRVRNWSGHRNHFHVRISP